MSDTYNQSTNIDDEKQLAFQSWKKDNEIANLFFKALQAQSKHLQNQLKNLYINPCSADDKLIAMGALSAKTRLIDEWLESDYDYFKGWSDLARTDKEVS